MADGDAAIARQDLWRCARGLTASQIKRAAGQRTDGFESFFMRHACSLDRRSLRFGSGGAMPVHPGKTRSGGMLSTSGKRTRRETQARARRQHINAGIAAGHATGRRRGVSKYAKHLPGLLSRGRPYVLSGAQLAARFSANEARPSEASGVWRLAACIRTRRAEMSSSMLIPPNELSIANALVSARACGPLASNC